MTTRSVMTRGVRGVRRRLGGLLHRLARWLAPPAAPAARPHGDLLRPDVYDLGAQHALTFRLREACRKHCELEALLGPDGKTMANAQDALRNCDVPIIVGPWLSEVGFELLYWIPWLRKQLPRWGVSPKRVIALSRGGVAGWYADVAARYVDAFDFCSPDEFLAGTRQREQDQKGKKQFRQCALGARLVQQARASLGLQDFVVLHPSLVYSLCYHVHVDLYSIAMLREACDFSPLGHKPPRLEGLPFADYVAIKFYHSDCFPRTPANERLARQLIGHWAQRGNVVVLNTGLTLDDHQDAAIGRLPNVFDATPLMTPRNNLAVQTAIVAHARRFVGTYGGFSYLAPLLDVPALAIYSHRNFVPHHTHLADEAFNTAGASRFLAASTANLDAFLVADAITPRAA